MLQPESPHGECEHWWRSLVNEIKVLNFDQKCAADVVAAILSEGSSLSDVPHYLPTSLKEAYEVGLRT